jgi:hypothetical protein
VELLSHLGVLRNPPQHASHPVHNAYSFVRRGLLGQFDGGAVPSGSSGLEEVFGKASVPTPLHANESRNPATRVAVNVMEGAFSDTVCVFKGTTRHTAERTPAGVSAAHAAGYST